VNAHPFRPLDRDAERSRLGVTGRLLLSVGNLVKLKGNDLVIQSLGALPDTMLCLVGEGPTASVWRR
jgi:teichuronic acid biosynthesis glycosyltransferase TuaC